MNLLGGCDFQIYNMTIDWIHEYIKIDRNVLWNAWSYEVEGLNDFKVFFQSILLVASATIGSE